ncbi:MAG: alpha/beta fold hydrolase [Flavobacteriales bacterium]|nr:alpha/beta fold hydrolase [Flavobacteriales bacterium]
MKLNYKLLGEGEPLIIAHGLFGSLDNWMSMAKRLAENFQVYLIDHRNHGKSPHSDEMSYDLMAEDLHEFIEEHELISPSIIGHSMGGKAAMALDNKYPGSLNKLVVIDIGIKEYPPHHQKILAGLNNLDLPSLRSRSQADGRLEEFVEESGVRQFLLKGLYRNKEGTYSLRYNLGTIQERMDNILSELNIEGSETKTLFIRGELSGYLLDEDILGLQKVFKNSDVATIPESGHWVHAEKPNELFDTLSDFLR